MFRRAGSLTDIGRWIAQGVLESARKVYGRLKNGYYGLVATLLTLVSLVGSGQAHELVMALTRLHAAACPDVIGFLRIDGHTRASLCAVT